MDRLKKVTVALPERVLRKAMRSSGQGITPTIRRGLELMAAADTYKELRRLRGRVKLKIDLPRLREDR